MARPHWAFDLSAWWSQVSTCVPSPNCLPVLLRSPVYRPVLCIDEALLPRLSVSQLAAVQPPPLRLILSLSCLCSRHAAASVPVSRPPPFCYAAASPCAPVSHSTLVAQLSLFPSSVLRFSRLPRRSGASAPPLTRSNPLPSHSTVPPTYDAPPSHAAVPCTMLPLVCHSADLHSVALTVLSLV
jgi:hypothetical protein